MDRRARGKKNDTAGRSLVLGCGLPQGSSTSPMLWNYYIKDLDATTSLTEQFSFADDISFHCSGINREEVIQPRSTAATKVTEFCQKWRVTLNSRKCKLLGFATGGRSPACRLDNKIFIGGLPVESETHFKFLGVLFDERLSFKQHCEETALKIKRKTRILKALGSTTWGADTKTMVIFRKWFIEPTATYGAGAFAVHGSDTSLNKIEVARNEALRVSTGCLRATPTVLLQTLGKMRHMRDIGHTEASITYEKAMRQTAETPVAKQIRNQVSRTQKFKHMWRLAASTIQANEGLLALSRIQRATFDERDNSCHDMSFRYSPVSAQQDAKTKRDITPAFKASIEEKDVAEFDLWKDGSASSLSSQSLSHLHDGERVSVKWDEGWYTGQLVIIDKVSMS